MQKLSKEQIVKAILDAGTVQSAIDNLYRTVLRMYDDLDSMEGYPVISKSTANYIYQAGTGRFGAAFMVAWIDRGMPEGDVEDWMADISACKLVWSTKMKADRPCDREFNPAVRIRFCDHLDGRVITPEPVPGEGGDDGL